jgi:hypothetical protein
MKQSNGIWGLAAVLAGLEIAIVVHVAPALTPMTAGLAFLAALGAVFGTVWACRRPGGGAIAGDATLLSGIVDARYPLSTPLNGNDGLTAEVNRLLASFRNIILQARGLSAQAAIGAAKMNVIVKNALASSNAGQPFLGNLRALPAGERIGEFRSRQCLPHCLGLDLQS